MLYPEILTIIPNTNIVAMRKEGGIEGRIETVTKVQKVGQWKEE